MMAHNAVDENEAKHKFYLILFKPFDRSVNHSLHLAF